MHEFADLISANLVKRKVCEVLLSKKNTGFSGNNKENDNN